MQFLFCVFFFSLSLFFFLTVFVLLQRTADLVTICNNKKKNDDCVKKKTDDCVKKKKNDCVKKNKSKSKKKRRKERRS